MRYFQTDLLCVFGRGIERVRIINPNEYSHRDAWRPTRTIEVMNDRGHHSGYRRSGISPDDDYSVIAGANANALAAVHFFQTLQLRGAQPKVAVFAAGRPDYLRDAPADLCEGTALRTRFEQKTRANVEIIMQSGNKNTRDDLEETLRLALDRQFRTATIISIGLHLPRCREFLRQARKARREFKGIRVYFVAAESVLADRYREIPRFARELAALQVSRAWQRTQEKEEQGVIALRDGTYTPGPRSS